MLLASMEAASHLGQRHFTGMPIRREIAGRELQLALINDALRKEGAFSSFYFLVPIVMTCVLVVFIVNEVGL
jgi:hypothetical protein